MTVTYIHTYIHLFIVNPEGSMIHQYYAIATRCGSDWRLLMVAGTLRAPRKFSHSLSSCAVVVIGRPSAPFDGLQLVRLSLWASMRVSFVTERMLPTDSASSMSSSTLCTYCLKSSRLDTAIARVDSRRYCSLILLKFLRRSSNNSFVRWLTSRFLRGLGRLTGSVSVIHIVIGMFTSNPMIPQYLNNNLT